MPDFPVLHCLPEFAQTHVYWVDNAIQSSHPLLLLLLLPPILPSIRVFSSELGSLHQVAKILERQLSVTPSNEYSELRLTVLSSLESKGLKSLLQHHNSKTSIILHSAFSMVQLSHLYLSTGKKMLGWMKYKLESRSLGEISITSDTQMTPPLRQKAKN